jgi:plastocyanin
MRRSITALAAAPAAVLLLAACSGGGAATTTSTTTGGEYQVAKGSFAFTPTELTVPVRATVTWVDNQGAATTWWPPTALSPLASSARARDSRSPSPRRASTGMSAPSIRA